MSEISFEEEKTIVSPSALEHTPPRLVQLILRTGIVADERQAEYVLLTLVFSLLAVAGAIYFFTGGNHAPVATPRSPNWPKPIH